MASEMIAVVLTVALTVATSIPIGRYMARVFAGEQTFLDPVFLPDRAAGPAPVGRRSARGAGLEALFLSLLVSNVFMWLVTFAVVTLQGVLLLNPDGIAGMEPTLAFNTISSFTTNTNLQHYSGETGLSYLSQMIVITFLQFVTAATGMAALRGHHPRPRRQPADEARQLLRGPDARRRARAAAARHLRGRGPHLAGHADDVRGRRQGDDSGRAPSRRSPAAWSRPRSRSSSWGRTAAATSGRTRRIPTRTRRRSRTSCETWSIAIIPMAMVWTLGVMVRRRARGRRSS